MGVIQDKWLTGKCRIEDGIYFGNDDFIPIEGAPNTGYTIGDRHRVAELISTKPNYWCELAGTTSSVYESSDLRLQAGETSWEGEGFLAVVTATTGELHWLLKLSTSEPFLSATLDGDVIRAVSDGYPEPLVWIVPIHAPEGFTVKSRRM